LNVAGGVCGGSYTHGGIELASGGSCGNGKFRRRAELDFGRGKFLDDDHGFATVGTAIEIDGVLGASARGFGRYWL